MKISKRQMEKLASGVGGIKLGGIRKRKRGETVDGKGILGENVFEMEKSVGHLTKKMKMLKLVSHFQVGYKLDIFLGYHRQ